MDRLYIEPTAQTPLVDFNGQTGDMTIKGRSIPDSPDEFWNKVLNWFERYVVEPTSKTTFNIDLEYFNVSSSKRILSPASNNVLAVSLRLEFKTKLFV